MNSYAILVGIIPLLVFVIVDSFFGMKAGLIAAVLLAIAEAVFSFFYFGELDSVTLVSVLLVVILAITSWFRKNEKLFLFQPVLLGVGIALTLLGSYFMGEPLFLKMAIKYQEFLPEQTRQMVAHPVFQRALGTLTLTSGIALLLHAALVAYAALRMSKWWWIAIRGIGFYVFLFLAALFARVH